MTREKAIECLDDMKVKIKIPKAAVQARENNEALDMAIKALEQQDKIEQIIDDCDLEAWEVLEKIKEVMR